MPTTQTIPKALIYEMDGDRPLYYKGYKEVLNGTKSIAEVVGSSKYQSFLLSLIVAEVTVHLKSQYLIGSNEIGLSLKKGHRAADVAIFDKATFKEDPRAITYASTPPKVVIEVDVKIEVEDSQSELSYVHRKTNALLEHGVEQVIWILTADRTTIVARPDGTWQTLDWEDGLDILGVNLVMSEIADSL